MEVGEYIRTRQGNIFKWDKYMTITKEEYREVDSPYIYINQNDIIKSSTQIIDLIEVGDYVNGMKITNKFIDEETGNIELEFNNRSSYLYPKSWNYEARSEEYKIKSIVTKESMESVTYYVK